MGMFINWMLLMRCTCSNKYDDNLIYGSVNNCTDTLWGQSAKDGENQSFLDHIQNNFWIKTRDIFGANTKKSIFVNSYKNCEMSRTPKSDKGKISKLSSGSYVFTVSEIPR